MDSKIEIEWARGRTIAQDPVFLLEMLKNGECLKCAAISSMAWKFRKIEKCSSKSALNIQIYYTWNSWQQYVDWKCVYHAHTQSTQNGQQQQQKKFWRSSLHNKFICTKSVAFVGRYVVEKFEGKSNQKNNNNTQHHLEFGFKQMSFEGTLWKVQAARLLFLTLSYYIRQHYIFVVCSFLRVSISLDNHWEIY